MKSSILCLSICMIAISLTQAQNVGIGQSSPISKLDVKGGVTVGSSYSGTYSAPANGAIIQGPVGIGNSSPNAAAILDLTNTSGLGLLLPKVPTTSLPSAPATGYAAYNSTTGCLQYWNGTSWVYITSSLLAGSAVFTASPASVTLGNTGIVYTITAGAASYTWTVPGGWTITAGSGTNSITVSLPANNTSSMATYGGTQTVSCVVGGACGSSSTLSTTVTVHGTQQFTTAGLSSTTVPAGISTLTIDMAGGCGGGSYYNNSGSGATVANSTAEAGRVQASLSITAGTALSVYVGAAGGTATSTGPGAGGTNGTTSAGGAGGTGTSYAYSGYGGGGGAASELQTAGTRILVAGGQGGVNVDGYNADFYIGGYGYTNATGTGVNSGQKGTLEESATGDGQAGTATGGASVSYNITGSCTAVASGAGSTAPSGAGGAGGVGYYKSGSTCEPVLVGGGGGGGYSGGGGGVGSGGGGSQYANPTYVTGNATFGVTPSAAGSNGYVYITW